MALKAYAFRLPDDLVALMDDTGSGRSEIVRAALDAWFSAGGQVQKKFDCSVLSDDGLCLYGLLSLGSLGSDAAERKLNWLGMRFGRAEAELYNLGAIRLSGGKLEIV